MKKMERKADWIFEEKRINGERIFEEKRINGEGMVIIGLSPKEKILLLIISF